MKKHSNNWEGQATPGAKGASLFMYYRQAGTGLSATLILLSSAMLAWVYKSRFELGFGAKIFFWGSICFLGAAILVSLFIQYFHYKGYFCYSRVLLEDSEYNNRATQFFNWADCSVDISMILFVVGIVSSMIFKFLDTGL